MPSDQTRIALSDIRDNGKLAQDFVAGLSFERFRGDRLFFYAVTRALEIISEAARRLLVEVRDRHPELPWRAIMGESRQRADYWRSANSKRRGRELRAEAASCVCAKLRRAFVAAERLLRSHRQRPRQTTDHALVLQSCEAPGSRRRRYASAQGVPSELQPHFQRRPRTCRRPKYSRVHRESSPHNSCLRPCAPTRYSQPCSLPPLFQSCLSIDRPYRLGMQVLPRVRRRNLAWFARVLEVIVAARGTNISPPVRLKLSNDIARILPHFPPDERELAEIAKPGAGPLGLARKMTRIALRPPC